MQIIPAILMSDVQELDSLLRKIRDSKKFERVQIDFVDGEFAANKTFKPMVVDVIPFMPLKFDAHLMVTENNITEWSLMAKKLGFDRIIAQMESISHPEEFLGLAFDVHSPVEALKKYLSKLEVVIVMSVEPGLGGQGFVDAAVKHVSDLSNLRSLGNLKFKICVDGGVEPKHLPILEKLGVDEVAVGAKRVLEWK